MFERLEEWGIDKRWVIPIILTAIGLVIILVSWVSTTVQDKSTGPIVEVISNTGKNTKYEVIVRSTDWEDTEIYVKAGKTIWPHNFYGLDKVRLKVGSEIYSGDESLEFKPKSSGNLFIKAKIDDEVKAKFEVEK